MSCQISSKQKYRTQRDKYNYSHNPSYKRMIRASLASQSIGVLKKEKKYCFSSCDFRHRVHICIRMSCFGK